jgi:hypothetical protein
MKCIYTDKDCKYAYNTESELFECTATDPAQCPELSADIFKLQKMALYF